MDNNQPGSVNPSGNAPQRPSFQPPQPPSRPAAPPLPPPPRPMAQAPRPPEPPRPIPQPPKPPQPLAPKPFGEITPPRDQVKIQPSPVPTAEARSLKSDVESLKASGGAAPKPQVIKLNELEESAAIFKPETINQMPGSVSKPPSMAMKKVANILGGLIVIVGLGLLGYYVVYPLVFPPQEVPAPKAVKPVVKQPGTLAHQSQFVSAPASVVNLNIGGMSAQDIFGLIQNEAGNSLPAGSIKELSVSGANGQAAFADFIGTLLDIGPESLRAVSADDFSGFIFYNSKGAWPGYVSTLRSGVAATDAMAVLAQLENTDIRRFYVADPGINDAWKDGPYKGNPVRFSAFSTPGASLNYGVIDGHIVIATSFDGFKKAIEQAGL